MAFTPLEKAGVGIAVAGGAAYAANAAVQAYIATGPTIANSLATYTTSLVSQTYNTAYAAALGAEATVEEATNVATNAVSDSLPALTESVQSIYGAAPEAVTAAINGATAAAPAIAEGATTVAAASTEVGQAVTAQAGTNAGSTTLNGATGYQTYIQVLMTALSVVGFARLVPDPQVTMNGEKTVSQIGFFQAITNMAKGALAFAKGLITSPKTELEPIIGNIETVGISVTNAIAATGALLVAGAAFLSARSGSGTPDAAATAATPNSIAINPAGDVLLNDMAAVLYYSTSTSTLFWSTSTATTVQGGEWWQVQQYFANTSSNSLISTLGLAKGWTDQLAGTVSNSSVLNLQQIIEAQTAANGNAINGIIQPSIPAFAGTLYYSDFINSCTHLISTLINIADTSTTLPTVIAAQIPILETARSNLANIISTDVFNQSQYLSQSNHLANLMNQATIYNNIKNNQPADVVQLYQSTINPKVLDTINAVSTLQDLTSVDSQTVINAVKTIQTQYSPTITGIPTKISRGTHFTIALGGGAPNGTATLTDYGAATQVQTYTFDANGNVEVNYVFATTRPPIPATLTIAFDNGYQQTYTIALT